MDKTSARRDPDPYSDDAASAEGPVDCSSFPLCQSARQLSARPERKRLRVSFTPCGEIAIVNGSPSIPISRRISLRSLVDIYRLILLGRSDVRIRRSYRRRISLWQVSRRSFRAGRENVLGVPFAALLAKAGITDETGFHQHDVSGLKNSLQMRGIALDEREHVPQPL